MIPQRDEAQPPHPALELFYCYARKDQTFRDEIDVHLAGLHRSKSITSWYDAMIVPGEDWEKVIQTHLDTADIILLLISPDFLNSDYCYGREMQRAIERHNKHEARVIPILLRPCDWTDTPFSTIQMLPTDAKPVTQWNDRDAAYADIALGIRRVVGELIAQRQQQERSRQRQQERAQKQRPKQGIPAPTIIANPTPPQNNVQNKSASDRDSTYVGIVPLAQQPNIPSPQSSNPPSVERAQQTHMQQNQAPILQPLPQMPSSKVRNQPSAKHPKVISRRNLLLGGGILFAATGGGIWFFVSHPPSPKPHTYESPSPTPYTYKGHSSRVYSVAWSPDGKRIASASDDQTVQVWNATDGSSPFTYKGHANGVYAIARSPDGKRIASASSDGSVQVWNAP